jgi:hypothetical protein
MEGIENEASKKFLIVPGTYSACLCLETIWRYTCERFMKYADEMGSGAMINVPSFISFGSDVQNLMGDTQTDRQTDTHTHTHAAR